VKAYEQGDLNGLRIIDAMAFEPSLPAEKSDGLMMLTKKKERLTKLLQNI